MSLKFLYFTIDPTVTIANITKTNPIVFPVPVLGNMNALF